MAPGPGEQVEPNLKGGEKPKGNSNKAAAAKAAAAKKAAAPKAPTAPKEGGVVRSASTISKEGEAKDEFDGKMYAVTKFPTSKNKAGETVRGTVTRANLPAWRAKRKEEREATKKKAAEAKAAKAAKDAADKAAAKAAEQAAEAATG